LQGELHLLEIDNFGIVKLQEKMAVPLDQQFKIERKGIIEQRTL
jgi:hypothetical protein